MQGRKVAIGLAVTALGIVTGSGWSQAVPTARKSLDLEFFGGASGVYTGLNGARNLSLTVGADVDFRRYFGVSPSLEVRGTLPVDKGEVIGEKSVLAGLRVSKRYGRYEPYGDFLFGRADLEYVHGLLNPQQTYLYTLTPSNVLSPGGGVNITLTDHFLIKADAQYQQFDTPVTASGHLHSVPITVAVVYRLGFGLPRRR